MSLKAKFFVALWVAAALTLAFNGWFVALLFFAVITAMYGMMALFLSVVPC